MKKGRGERTFMQRTLSRAQQISILMLTIVPLFGVRAAAEEFEGPPREEPANSLSAAQVANDYFHIDSPVLSDGLMHHYVIDTRFGVFSAYGRTALQTRLSEVAALATIARTSAADVVVRSVGRSLQEDTSSVVELAKSPVRTVTGIPLGIAHLLGGYRAQAEEISAEVGKHTAHSGKSAGASTQSLVNKTSAAATHYADRYLGVTAAQMRWYAKLGVDPYTSNQPLRDGIKRLAKIDAATTFGMHFAPVPGIPYAGDIRRALNTIYNEDPAVLRKRRRETLAAYGLIPQEIERFENTFLLSPTRQTVLVEAAQRLAGVAGRAELFRHAMTVTSEEEVEVFLTSTRMLAQFHISQHPVTRVLAGLRLPAGQLADGSVVIFGAFDAIYWTEEVAGYERTLEQALPPEAGNHELWLRGSISARARRELEQRGWSVHEAPDPDESPLESPPQPRA
jgi:hypothetical protein